MDHRWGRRVEVDVQVTFRDSAFTLCDGRLTDVSLSGGFVRSARVPGVMSHIGIMARSGPRRSGPKFEIAAFVVREEPGGFGVEWEELDPDAVRSLIGAREPVARGRARTFPPRDASWLKSIDQPGCPADPPANSSHRSDSELLLQQRTPGLDIRALTRK